VHAVSRIFGINLLPMRGHYNIPHGSRRDPLLIYMERER
jgi:hypothetical protein